VRRNGCFIVVILPGSKNLNLTFLPLVQDSYKNGNNPRIEVRHSIDLKENFSFSVAKTIVMIPASIYIAASLRRNHFVGITIASAAFIVSR